MARSSSKQLVVVVVAAILLTTAAVASVLADRAPGAPPLRYSGVVLAGGEPIPDGLHTIGLVLATTETEATGVLCEVGPSSVATVDGHFSLELDADPRCGAAIQQETELYVGLSVDGTSLPRARVGATPFSVVAENGVPAGTVMAFAGESVPTGWLPCDGRALDASAPQYASLFAAIGTSWGTGTNDSDPATDFNIPDLRGRFLRGVDTTAAPVAARDEDRSARTASAPGGATGAQVGTLQDDAFELHDHDWPWYRAGAGRNLVFDDPAYVMGGGTYEVGGARGGAETRPENAAVLYIIRL